MTTEQKQTILKLHDDGKGYGEIAKITGISKNSISTYFKRQRKKKIDNCLFCGKPLIQTKGHRQKLYCNDYCRRNDWIKKNQTSIKRIEHKCKCCGKTFYGYESQHPSFCSRDCFYNFRRGDFDGIK